MTRSSAMMLPAQWHLGSSTFVDLARAVPQRMRLATGGTQILHAAYRRSGPGRARRLHIHWARDAIHEARQRSILSAGRFTQDLQANAPRAQPVRQCHLICRTLGTAVLRSTGTVNASRPNMTNVGHRDDTQSRQRVRR
jgi:hypothetical protein